MVALDPHPLPQLPTGIPFSAQLTNQQLGLAPSAPVMLWLQAPFPPLKPMPLHAARQPLLKVSDQKACACKIAADKTNDIAITSFNLYRSLIKIKLKKRRAEAFN
jgi:hypothetical protein